MVFVPAYRDGQVPSDQWQARQLFGRSVWYKHGILNDVNNYRRSSKPQKMHSPYFNKTANLLLDTL